MTTGQGQPSQRVVNAGSKDKEHHVLGVIGRLAGEFVGRRRPEGEITLDSRLDRDLGFDSLGRAELISRIEKEFETQLPPQTLAEAQTPRELLRALESTVAPERWKQLDPTIRAPATRAVAAPGRAATLTQVLDWHANENGERTHLVLLDETNGTLAVSYQMLRDGAQAVARELLRAGLEPGDRAALMLPTGRAFFEAFFGILYAGGIPVPIYPPARLSQIEDHLRRQARVLNSAGATALVTVPEARPAAAFLKSQVASLRQVATVEALKAGFGPELRGISDASAIALLQYTSGSTGDPKGVTLTHTNLLANIRAYGERLEIDSSDVCVSWLPLYHDMGLIGTWLGSLYYAATAVVFSPLTFLTRPEQWLRTIHRHRGTISAAPNFAYEMCVRKIEDSDIEGVDLSCWRRALNGAEPVSPKTIERFTARFAKFGLRREAMMPVYGMAENAVALAIPELGRGPIIDRVAREAMTRYGEAKPAEEGDPTALEFVACGTPLRGHQVRIVDDGGREVEDRRQGRLQFRGPSATSGYYRNEAKTRELFAEEWLNSGDLAYVASGEVYITGRSKDIIIRAGRNIYPHEIEEAVGSIPGVRKGCVAVFGSKDVESGTEKVVLAAETRLLGAEEKRELLRRVEERATELLEGAPDETVLVAPHAIPKTSSGKIRRSAARELYESGQLAGGRLAAWRQMARLGSSALLLSMRRAAIRASGLAYSLYFWLVSAGAIAAAWLLVMTIPGLGRRFSALRGIARFTLSILGIPVRTTGMENVRGPGGIVVANHASYLDSLILMLVLPGVFQFVAKRELAGNFFTRSFLNRIGALFVERFQPAGSRHGARDIAAAATEARLVIFPEGTFTRMPGLLDFRLGAFLSAVETGVPVFPVTIRGTRSILRDGQWLPRRGPVYVEAGEALLPEEGGFDAAVRLRGRARTEILRRCGEPDLAGEQTILGQARTP